MVLVVSLTTVRTVVLSVSLSRTQFEVFRVDWKTLGSYHPRPKPQRLRAGNETPSGMRPNLQP